MWIGDLLKEMNCRTILCSKGKCCILDALGAEGMYVRKCKAKKSDLNNHSKYPSVSMCEECITKYMSEEC